MSSVSMNTGELNKVFEKETIIGTRVTKPDAPDKATGKTIYINDMVLPRMLFGKILHTDHRRPARWRTSRDFSCRSD